MRIPVPDQIPAAEELGRVHFVGIGGAALSGIARIMARRGVTVSGSDNVETPFLAAVREVGVPVTIGYRAEHLTDLAAGDTLVVTTAAREDNPEVVEGLERGLRLWPRSAGLKSVMHGRRVLSVAGTHGKTTASSMLTVALIACGVDPSYAVGGVLAATGRNSDAGAGELFVAEADESDGAFLVYDTFAGIVLNIDADHLDVWGSPEAYAAAFETFADRIDPDGFMVCCIDDPGAAALAARAKAAQRRVVTVGFTESADVRLGDLESTGAGSRFSVSTGGRTRGVELQVPGRHYAIDAAAALTVGLKLGLDFDDLAAGLASFAGTGRRMEFKGEAAGVRVFDSYAHHPTEIDGDLEAARQVAGEGRLIVVFQPHLVSRTRIFGADMGRALGAADEVVVTELYVAREDPDPAVTGALVADAVPLPAPAVALTATLAEAADEAVARARPGDLVLTLGAGDVTELGPVILSRLTAGR